MRLALSASALLAALALAACTPPAAEAPATTTTTAVAENTVSTVVTAPAAGARVTSPLHVEGTAPGDWFFEAQFPAELRSASGEVLAEAPARAQSDWMTEAPVPYAAELQFTVTEETQATLVLQEDMPADNANPRQISIPVVLAPAD